MEEFNKSSNLTLVHALLKGDELQAPIIAVTMGDAAGIGPEVTVKTLLSRDVWEVARPVAVGDCEVIRDVCRAANLDCGKIKPVDRVKDADFRFGILNLLDKRNIRLKDLVLGRPQAMAGKAAFEYVETAVKLALEKRVDGIATAPINKEALRTAGYPFPGHTEILAHLTGGKKYAMMFVVGNRRVILVTIHAPLKEVPRLITRARVHDVVTLADDAAQDLGVVKPRIAVAGLNPHAGESGLFGDEELTTIMPAIADAKARGICVEGPFPADSVFYRAFEKGEFDIVAAMYHDQGCIPIKLVGFESAVNVTVGLPIVRTSVDHGTAYDLVLARRGGANPQSLIEAVKMAARIAANRQRREASLGGA